MMSRREEESIKYIKIENSNGQELIKLIHKKFKNQSIIDNKYKILKEKGYILFPLIKNDDLINLLIELLEDKFFFKIISMKGTYHKNYKYKNIKEALENKIPSKFIDLIPNSYDIIGEIAIIEFDKFQGSENQELNSLKLQIAKAITEGSKSISSVFEKKSEIKGTYRLRELNLLYGENKTETIHKENMCIFKLDIKQTFFTPRLVYERNRIANSNIKGNEVIMDLFAGVGPFSIQIAKKHPVTIHSFDINRIAYNYLQENIGLNKLMGIIIPHHINISALIDPLNNLGSILKHKADRVIMNLPEKSLDYTDIACFLMKKSGGILHNYQFCEKPNSIEKAQDKLKFSLKELNWQIEEVLKSKIVKSYSPKSELVVHDLKIKSIT